MYVKFKINSFLIQFFLFIIAIIMEFYLCFITKIYIIFHNLYIIINIYVIKKIMLLVSYIIKKLREKKYEKYRCNVTKIIYFKLKILEKEIFQ